MNTKDLECILKIAEEQNLTKAAQKLFLSPSALTQKLSAMERELGCQLFHRSRNGCFPTEAGEAYLRFASSILNQERDIKKELLTIRKRSEETITVGFPPERGSAIFSKLYPVFHRSFPSVTLQLVEANVHTQQALIAQGKLDLGFVTLLEEQKIESSHYIPLQEEELLFVGPKALFPTGFSMLSEIDLSAFAAHPFALMQGSSTTRAWQDSILSHYSLQPRIAFETSRSDTILNMVSLGFCCSLISDFYFDAKKEDVQYAALPEHPKWHMYISYRRGAYLSPATTALMEIVRSLYPASPF